MTSDLQPQITQMNTDEPAAEKHLRSSVPSAAKEEPAPKISVIVPVYKVEKYLPECIESVLAQTFTDFELILVDDGSPDNSGAICDDYMKKDSRIRVFHKENGGVSSARNLGLDNARGEWIAFVDPDDWIDEEMFEKMFFAGTESGADFVWCDFWTESDSMIALHRQNVVSADTKNMIEGLLSGRLHGSVWCKLTRAAVLRENKIYFSPEIGFCEDLLVSIRLAKCAGKSVHLPFPFYHYRVRENSATSKSSEHKSLEDYTFVLEQVRKILHEDSDLFDSALNAAACAHKAKLLKFGSFASSTLRRIRCEIRTDTVLPLADKYAIIGFNVFGRIGALPFVFTAKTISFFKAQLKALIVGVLKKQYGKNRSSVKIAVTDKDCRLYGKGGRRTNG